MPIFSAIAGPYKEKKHRAILLGGGRNISKLLRECIVTTFAGFPWPGKEICRDLSVG
jgi:hypothetical protein